MDQCVGYKYSGALQQSKFHL